MYETIVAIHHQAAAVAMNFLYIRLMLAVTLLVCLLVAVILIAQYSKMAAVVIWFVGSGSLRTLKHIKPLKSLNPPQIEKLDLLDTEYAAIVAASRNEAGDVLYHPAIVVRDIVNYRTATKQSVRDILLYRISNSLQLFTPDEKQALAQQNRKLDDSQKQRVKEVLVERFGVTLS